MRWIHGDAAAPPDVVADLATMTANVAQVFVTDESWDATLRGILAAVRPGGHLVVETRIPQTRAWERWTREHSFVAVDILGTGEGGVVTGPSRRARPTGTGVGIRRRAV